MKNIIWVVVSGVMALCLTIAACGQPTTTTMQTTQTTQTTPSTPATATTTATPTITSPVAQTTPGAVTPKYGGMLNLVSSTDITGFDGYGAASGSPVLGHVIQPLWTGDWAKGPAGGYGTNQTTWGSANNDLYDLKIGLVAESTKWTIDQKNYSGTIVQTIRQGIHWALNPALEASRLVNGRELTADDVVFNLKRVLVQGAYIYNSNAELRTANITKTGPWEVTIKVPLDGVSTALSRLTGQTYMVPPEVVAKYGNMYIWKYCVGTGPFMISDCIPGSLVKVIRNSNYYQKDPAGPGKGNQLPYVDGVNYLIIPDASTRAAALRSGKIDQMSGFSMEDANQMKKTNPNLIESEAFSNQGRGTPLMMRLDKPELPFKDIRVRQAMTLAIDFQSILKGYFGGVGQIMTFPFAYEPEYAELYLGLDDPEFPPATKELYGYNPDKAKQLLKEAGYPNGFKTELVITSDEVDYNSIIRDYFSKVGIDMSFKVMEVTAKSNLLMNRQQTACATYTTSPMANFNTSVQLQGVTRENSSCINDPVVNDYLDKVRLAACTDQHQAMKIYKEMSKYIVQQTYVIPNVIGHIYTFWQPWLKGYSGEWTMGGNTPIWPQYIWYDEPLKKSMGY